MPGSMRPGDVLAERYRLIDLLSETRGGRFWRAWDTVLSRPVAIHLIAHDDPRAEPLLSAARDSAQLHDPRLLRVLDAGTLEPWCYVVNEWGEGRSLDIMLAEEPLSPRRAAWIAGEVAELLATAHRQGITHGRLVPDNVLVDQRGSVKVIGFAVDAALNGVRPATPASELLDLVGVLYAALTGRWPRSTPCRVPTAPEHHGLVLRPRQVRAGVPRVLDSLCDAALNPGHVPGVVAPRSPDRVAAALFDFVGDRHAMAEAEVVRNRGNTSPRIPVVDALVWAPDPPPAEDPGEETQVGLPSFDDEVLDPDWRTPSPEPPPPPPPFEDSPARPLFAPDPPDGQPVRVPRDDIALPEPAEFWPWETDPSQVPVVEEPEPEEPVPGRGWMRGAALLALALVVLLVMVYAFNRGRDDADRNDSGSDGEPSSETLAQVTPAAVFDFDPFGDPPEEKPELVPLAVDGDPATAWETQGYRDPFGPEGLKPGVGLLLDLGAERQVREVRIQVIGNPTAVTLLATSTAARPTRLGDLHQVAAGTSKAGQLRLVPESTEPQRWLAIWLTSVPQDGDYRGRIAEVQVFR
ncbi:protein kinase family protein [Nocardioides daejeonensis]|uniref:protein kinase family protein n=1 Tax=Nocardioides daejeonensis TaxID=1046556 RepID=UPI0013A56C6D|nr:protein kinase family protein [Nocardioides daejeonensis]